MINLLCIVITFTVIMFTLWYCNGKDSELENAVIAQRKAENQLTELENRYKQSQRHFEIAHDNCKELQCDVANKRSTILYQQEEVKALRDNIKKLHDELGLRQKLKAIKFTAKHPLYGFTKSKFKLGLVPCGLTVNSLKWTEFDDRYVLTQYHSNGSRKEFEYLKEDIKGCIKKYLND